MRKVIGVFLFVLFLPSCPGRGVDTAGKPAVVCSIFVVYDVARAIGGEEAAISLFTPPGAEPHTYEPSARDILGLKNARLFLYTGGLMEPWADRVLQAVGGPTLTATDVTRGIELLTAVEEESGHTAQGHDHTNGPVDPHFWLDPLRLATAAGNVEEALVGIDPAHGDLYRQRAAQYRAALEKLDRDIREGLAGRKGSTLVYGGHNTFGYFGIRYGLSFISPYAGFSPQAEPQARKLVELRAMMEKLHLSVIYYGEGVDPQVARTLAASVNGRLVMLHAAHNVSAEELAAGVTYLSIMRDNLAKLKADPGLFGP
jgi:zinc transport system substrate-binding protein